MLAIAGTTALIAVAGAQPGAAHEPGKDGKGMGMGPGAGPGMSGCPYQQGMMNGGMMGPGMMQQGMMNGGMMGPGMAGQGMAGQGMGPGMMNQGMQGGGMGYGMGNGMMQPLRQDLTADDVRHILGHRLEWAGNPHVKVGKVEEKDDDTIVAEIVTQEDSLVQRLEINRHTGWMQQIE
jgi:hypothetical protein